MATPVFCCGFECGVDTGSTGHGILTGATYNTTGSFVRSGARSLRCNGVASNFRATSNLTSSNIWVYRFYIYFSTLPTDNIVLCNPDLSTRAGAFYRTSDGKIYAGSGNTTGSESFGATGVSVTTGQWYMVDVRINSSANPWLIDVSVNGVACGQISSAIATSSATQFIAGTTVSVSISTYDYYLDDLIISNTSADYPLGPGYVNHFIPTSDGTHNIAGANDFERSATGTDITNATTTAFQLIDDVPLKTGTPTEYINLIAPPNATDYVEVVFGPAPGVSTPSIAPRAVEAIVAHASSATGTNNIRLALNDNGSLDDIANGAYHSSSAAIVYHRKHYADPPSAASAWTIVIGNGNFNNVSMRCFTSDAAPDPWWASAMIEAEFAEAAFIAKNPYMVKQAVNRSGTY